MEAVMKHAAVRNERPIGFDQFKLPTEMTNAIGIVKRLPNEMRDYGFLTVTGIHHDVFVPLRIIGESGLRQCFLKGARVVCDLKHRLNRGYVVTKIHSIHPT